MDEEKSKYVGINPDDLSRRIDLLEAARTGQIKIVEERIHLGCNIDQANTVGKTALTLAAECGESEVVEFLCDHGADIEHLDYGQWTARKHADYHGHKEIVDHLDKVTHIRQSQKRLSV